MTFGPTVVGRVKTWVGSFGVKRMKWKARSQEDELGIKEEIGQVNLTPPPPPDLLVMS